ncbi:hypothetical protein AZH53_00855 [Methanomicrobiaceae archaeon CYW5]|nr:hypothetical protein [Methanovulcanius yangii]
MRHLPQTSMIGKNGSDLQMTIDVLSDLQNLPVDTFILGSGDTDFIPLVRSIIEKGKKVHIVGFESSVGNAIKRNCTKYKSMEDLLGLNEEENIDLDDIENSEDLSKFIGRNLLVRFSKTHPGGEPILLSQLKERLRRMDPSFTEKNLGFSSFKSFIDSYVGDVIEKLYDDDKTGHPLAVFKDISKIEENEKISEDDVNELEIKDYIIRHLRYPQNNEIRLDFSQKIIDIYKKENSASMKEIIDYIADNIEFDYPKIGIKKFVYALGQGRAIHYENQDGDFSLFNRPQKLNEDVPDKFEIERIYQKRIFELVSKRFPETDASVINEFLK